MQMHLEQPRQSLHSPFRIRASLKRRCSSVAANHLQLSPNPKCVTHVGRAALHTPLHSFTPVLVLDPEQLNNTDFSVHKRGRLAAAAAPTCQHLRTPHCFLSVIFAILRRGLTGGSNSLQQRAPFLSLIADSDSLIRVSGPSFTKCKSLCPSPPVTGIVDMRSPRSPMVPVLKYSDRASVQSLFNMCRLPASLCRHPNDK